MTIQDRNALITESVVKRARDVTLHIIHIYGIPHNLEDDLYSAANLALVEARDKWDGRGSFWGFSVGYIQHRVIDEIRVVLGRTGKRTINHSDRTLAIKRAGELFEWDHPIYIEQRYDRLIDRKYLLTLPKTSRQREILLLRLLDFTLAEIAEYYGLSEGRISQIISKISTYSARIGSDETWMYGVNDQRNG